MKKLNELASSFLQKDSKKGLPSTTPMNSFRSLFDIKKLSDEEASYIKELIPEIAEQDFFELTRLTGEIKSIQKQGILLLGERICQAKKLFEKYPGEYKGFTKWLSFAFSSVKSAYNALGFYDLYQQLPTTELKEKLKQMPAKTAYILASRQGNFEDKIHVIENFVGQSHETFLPIIDSALPIAPHDKRKKDSFLKVIHKCRQMISYLDTIDEMDEEKKKIVKQLILELQTLIGE